MNTLIGREEMSPLIKLGAVAMLLGMSEIVCAQSSVTVSGSIDVGLSYTTHTGDGTQSKLAVADSILGVSNVGFSGREDLGDGLSAIYNLQAGFNPSTGAQNAAGVLFSRNAFVGLDSKFGALTIGKQWNFNDDWLVGSVFKGGYNSGAIFKFSEFDAVSELYNNTIKYVSPIAGGFQGGVLYGVGGAAGSTKTGQLYNIGAKYSQGPLLLAATYDHEQDGTANIASNGSIYKLTTLGGSYGFGAYTARLGVAFSDISGPGAFQSIPSLSSRKAYAIEAGLNYAFTPAFVGSADAIYRKNTTLSNTSRLYRLLGIYSLSKHTSLVANIAYLDNAGGASEALVNTDSTAVGGGFANTSQASVALGIRLAF